MQECFRQYPEIYGAELSDEEDAVADNSAEPIPATETTPAPAAPASASAPDTTTEDYQKLREPSPSTSALLSNIGDSQPEPIPSREASDNIPAKWDDATGANDQVREREATEKKEKKEN
jgi:mitochondrial intermembrane space import and assembly protein 40